MGEELEAIERKTPRTLVCRYPSFLDIRPFVPVTLVFPDRHVAVFLPNKAFLVGMYCVLIAFGIGCWVFGGITSYQMYWPEWLWLSIAPILLLSPAGLVLIVWGVAGLMGKIDDGCVVLDRRRGVIAMQPHKTDRVAADDMRIRNVAAVQLCSAIIHGVEGEQTTFFALNLVLRKPAGERVRILSRTREAIIRADAKQLAKFLDVPLWDHATG